MSTVGNPVSLVGFGYPSNPRTTSGFARSVYLALQRAGRLGREYSLKHLRPLDVLRGAIRLRRSGYGWRAEVSRAWMWSKAGCDTISRHLAREIHARGDSGPFLQFGTLAEPDPSLGLHFMRTDMTVAQARRAKSFAVSQLSPEALDVAEAIQARNLELAAGVFASCEWTADSLVKDCGVPRDKIHITYTGGNIEFPQEPPERRCDHEILFVGRDWERKGGTVLAEAFRRVQKAVPRAKLTVIGCTPSITGDGVEVVGSLDTSKPDQLEELKRLFHRATLLCHPALFDPFPNVLIEAAWAGLPVVSIDNGSRREAVVHGETGLLIPDEDAGLLAEAILQLLEAPERATTMGQNARRRAQEVFSWDAIARKVCATIDAKAG